MIVTTTISSTRPCLGAFKQGVSKQGVATFAWRQGSQYDVAATRGTDNVLASECRAQFRRPATRRGCRICVTGRLPVRPRGETMHQSLNANTPLPLLNVPDLSTLPDVIYQPYQQKAAAPSCESRRRFASLVLSSARPSILS